MVDTLQLVIPDYDASEADLQLQPAVVHVKSGEMIGNFPLYWRGNSMVEGRAAFNNDGPCRVTIKAIPSRDERGMQPLCTVAFEVPKVAGASNYYPTDKAGTEDALRRIQAHLTGIGLKTNIWDAQPARLDAFRNIIAEEPYSCYSPVLRLLGGSRMEQRGYENGALWENGVQQVCAYDKLQKMVRDKLDIAGLPANTIRFEMRLLKSRKVRDTLNVRTARELLDSYDEIINAYERTMKQQLFRHDVKSVDALVFSELTTGMRYFRERDERNWMQSYVTACGYQFLMMHTSIDTVMAAVTEVEDDKDKRSRLKKKLKETRFATEAVLACGPSRRTTGQLYEEMREKVFTRLAA